MLLRSTIAALAAAALAGCTPALNWRTLPVGDTGLKAMFPCKPDQDSRQLPLVGRNVTMHALACRSGSTTFAVLAADIGAPAAAPQALRDWRAASLARLQAHDARTDPFHPPGALDVADSVQVTATGRRPDGSAVQSRAAYFAHGQHVFEAVVLGDAIGAEQADPFFGGLRFQ